ncbi:hypothetical protein DPMN_046849 [Dreissena polymorpha]|uniref:Uncharacterized protein n=1 Tax=Dreissena polymorpha TaxID=45954 RepID=A0A9D4I0Y3_DREPO|nr:hypothetical protein DPMN_046849 [Dreissena polymorpha]
MINKAFVNVSSTYKSRKRTTTNPSCRRPPTCTARPWVPLPVRWVRSPQPTTTSLTRIRPRNMSLSEVDPFTHPGPEV